MQSISNDREIRKNIKSSPKRESPKKQQNQKPTKDGPEQSYGK
jgi:hypothetical protein